MTNQSAKRGRRTGSGIRTAARPPRASSEAGGCLGSRIAGRSLCAPRVCLSRGLGRPTGRCRRVGLFGVRAASRAGVPWRFPYLIGDPVGAFGAAHQGPRSASAMASACRASATLRVSARAYRRAAVEDARFAYRMTAGGSQTRQVHCGIKRPVPARPGASGHSARIRVVSGCRRPFASSSASTRIRSRSGRS